MAAPPASAAGPTIARRAAHDEDDGGRRPPARGAAFTRDQQIAEGAPFDLFAAANVTDVDAAVRAGSCRADSKASYARGRVVVCAVMRRYGFLLPGETQTASAK